MKKLLRLFGLAPYRMMEEEMNIKNKAFYFILSNGLLEDYARFNNDYRSKAPHGDCLNELEGMLDVD